MNRQTDPILQYQNKRFDVYIDSSDYFQFTYLTFMIAENGKFRVPKWDLDDDRWKTEGMVILNTQAKQINLDEYQKITSHYEDDWYCWNDVCYSLEDLDDRNNEVGDNTDQENQI